MDDSEQARWVLVYHDGDTAIESEPMTMDAMISAAMQTAQRDKSVSLRDIGKEKSA